MVRAFVHGAMGRRIDPSWSGPIELFLVPAHSLVMETGKYRIEDIWERSLMVRWVV